MKDSLNYADYHVNFYAFFMDQYTFETMRLDPSIGSFTAVEIQNTYNEQGMLVTTETNAPVVEVDLTNDERAAKLYYEEKPEV